MKSLLLVTLILAIALGHRIQRKLEVEEPMNPGKMLETVKANLAEVESEVFSHKDDEVASFSSSEAKNAVESHIALNKDISSDSLSKSVTPYFNPDCGDFIMNDCSFRYDWLQFVQCCHNPGPHDVFYDYCEYFSWTKYGLQMYLNHYARDRRH